MISLAWEGWEKVWWIFSKSISCLPSDLITSIFLRWLCWIELIVHVAQREQTSFSFCPEVGRQLRRSHTEPVRCRVHSPYSGTPYFEFPYLLKCTCSTQINTPNVFPVIHRHAQNSKMLVTQCIHSQLRSNMTKLWLCFSSPTINTFPFRGLFSAKVFWVFFFVFLFFLHFCAFCWWLYCLKWPQAVAEMLSSVPNSKKAVVCFM